MIAGYERLKIKAGDLVVFEVENELEKRMYGTIKEVSNDMIHINAGKLNKKLSNDLEVVEFVFEKEVILSENETLEKVHNIYYIPQRRKNEIAEYITEDLKDIDSLYEILYQKIYINGFLKAKTNSLKESSIHQNKHKISLFSGVSFDFFSKKEKIENAQNLTSDIQFDKNDIKALIVLYPVLYLIMADRQINTDELKMINIGFGILRSRSFEIKKLLNKYKDNLKDFKAHLEELCSYFMEDLMLHSLDVFTVLVAKRDLQPVRYGFSFWGMLFLTMAYADGNVDAEEKKAMNLFLKLFTGKTIQEYLDFKGIDGNSDDDMRKILEINEGVSANFYENATKSIDSFIERLHIVLPYKSGDCEIDLDEEEEEN